METQQLKKYLKTILDLEGSLYKNENLKNSYSKQRNEGIPQMPKNRVITRPSSPVLYTPSKQDANTNTANIFGGIFCLIIGVIFLFALDFDTLGFLPLIIIIVGLFFLISGIHGKAKHKADTQAAESKYQRELKEYNKKLREYEVEHPRIVKENELAMERYRKTSAQYSKETNKNTAELNDLTTKLQDSLSQLYAQGIIYPKYQNIVAIATIYEYLDSGRCTDLEGPNGAYNLYESELRANLIIGSLVQINKNLQGIRENQFALYTLIDESNHHVTQLLSQIHDEQVRTTYYTQTIAAVSQANLMLNAIQG